MLQPKLRVSLHDGSDIIVPTFVSLPLANHLAQLFIDAAKRVRPGFVLEPTDLDPLAEILRLASGLPLGILLAAGWVDVLPVREIAAEIAKNLDFLQTELGDVPDRHRSLRAAFDTSWAHLGPEERKSFLALSVLRRRRLDTRRDLDRPMSSVAPSPAEQRPRWFRATVASAREERVRSENVCPPLHHLEVEVDFE